MPRNLKNGAVMQQCADDSELDEALKGTSSAEFGPRLVHVIMNGLTVRNPGFCSASAAPAADAALAQPTVEVTSIPPPPSHTPLSSTQC